MEWAYMSKDPEEWWSGISSTKWWFQLNSINANLCWVLEISMMSSLSRLYLGRRPSRNKHLSSKWSMSKKSTFPMSFPAIHIQNRSDTMIQSSKSPISYSLSNRSFIIAWKRISTYRNCRAMISKSFSWKKLVYWLQKKQKLLSSSINSSIKKKIKNWSIRKLRTQFPCRSLDTLWLRVLKRVYSSCPSFKPMYWKRRLIRMSRKRGRILRICHWNWNSASKQTSIESDRSSLFSSSVSTKDMTISKIKDRSSIPWDSSSSSLPIILITFTIIGQERLFTMKSYQIILKILTWGPSVLWQTERRIFFKRIKIAMQNTSWPSLKKR